MQLRRRERPSPIDVGRGLRNRRVWGESGRLGRALTRLRETAGGGRCEQLREGVGRPKVRRWGARLRAGVLVRGWEGVSSRPEG